MHEILRDKRNPFYYRKDYFLKQYKMKNHLKEYHYDLYTMSENEYVLSFENRYFKIEKTLYNILNISKTAETFEDLYDRINEKHSYSKIDLQNLLNQKLIPLFESKNQPKHEKSNSFWIQRQILNESMVEKIAKPFSNLYGRFFYPILILITISFVVLLKMVFQEESIQITSTQPDFIKWVLSYVFLFLIIFLHETGHAAAAIKSGIKPRSIGLGFYTVLPVMYTDLTDAWRLSRDNKIKINLGGIYMQLIINILLSIFFFITSTIFLKEILIYLLTINATIILVNLFPLLKFDGYWVVSDFMRIPNLINESNQQLIRFVTKKGPFDHEISTPLNVYQKIFLVFYSLTRVVFIITMVVFITLFILISISKTFSFISLLPYMDFNTSTYVEIFKKLLTFVIVFILSKKYINIAKNYLFNKKSND